MADKKSQKVEVVAEASKEKASFPDFIKTVISYEFDEPVDGWKKLKGIKIEKVEK